MNLSEIRPALDMWDQRAEKLRTNLTLLYPDAKIELRYDGPDDAVVSLNGVEHTKLRLPKLRQHKQRGSDCLLVDGNAAADLIGVSRATFWKLHAQGRVPLPIRLASRLVRWRKQELQAWVLAGCPGRDKWSFNHNT